MNQHALHLCFTENTTIVGALVYLYGRPHSKCPPWHKSTGSMDSCTIEIYIPQWVDHGAARKYLLSVATGGVFGRRQTGSHERNGWVTVSARVRLIRVGEGGGVGWGLKWGGGGISWKRSSDCEGGRLTSAAQQAEEIDRPNDWAPNSTQWHD